MAEVAELAGVSASTVSLFLRAPEGVAAEKRARIARVIEALGYVPNPMAGGLAAASSRVVSVIVPSVLNAFFAETVAALQVELASAGLQLLLGHAEYSEAQEERLVRAALSWAPAAVVLTGLHHSRATRQMLLATQAPVIEMWELGGAPLDMAVGFFHQDVGGAATRHLLSRGRRTIAFLGARMAEDRRAVQRSRGYLGAMAEAGKVAPGVLDVPGTASVEAGAAQLRRALDEVPGLDAVVCSNDVIALGVLFESQRRGLRVPDDLSVIGFGDLQFAAWSNPALTTIRPFGEAIGKEVARLIGRDTAAGDEAARIIDTGFQLVARGST